jgi:hypothetical protein
VKQKNLIFEACVTNKVLSDLCGVAIKIEFYFYNFMATYFFRLMVFRNRRDSPNLPEQVVFSRKCKRFLEHMRTNANLL